MDSKLYVFERRVKGWGSEHVQNIKTMVSTCYRVNLFAHITS